MLTDIIKLRRLSPWSIEIDNLIRSFSEKMFQLDVVDFRVSGLAIFSASLLHRLKTEELLRVDDENEETSPQIDEEFKLLPPITPPFRQTSRRVSIGELLVALEHVLKEERKPKKKRLLSKSLINDIKPLVYAIDPDRTQIERTIMRVYNKIKQISRECDVVKFTDILIDKTTMGIVRTLFCILILGFRGYIDVWQEEEFGDIFIELILDKESIDIGELNEVSIS
ncbi:MAG: hypothetical protein ACTSYR_03065 [Candidatus Odinarchaeia archaeon]